MPPQQKSPPPMPAHFRRDAASLAEQKLREKPVPAVPLEQYAELGDPVYWHPGADENLTPLPGVVVALGVRTVDLSVFSSSLHGIVPTEAVMHMDDPNARTERNGGGGWRHRPILLAVRRLMLALGALRWNGKDRYEVVPEFDPSGLASLLTPPAAPPAVVDAA